MAAKLRWEGDALWLGEFVVGELKRVTGVRSIHRYWAGRRQSATYENPQDCMQDCETEVRRLLKKAGVDL